MRRLLGRLIAIGVAMAAVAPTTRAEVDATDDAGQRVRLSAPAQRIVSLAPHATELLFAAGAGNHVVGVSAFSDYPEAARRLPKISGGTRVDMERLLALKPDLVIGWRTGNVRADLDAIRAQGVPVFIAEPRRLEDVPITLENLGRLAGTGHEAGRAASEFRERLTRLRDQYQGRTPVRVFIEVSEQPLMTLSHVHMLNDVVMLCGGRNVFGASELIAPEISREAVQLEDPDVVLFSDELGSVEAVRAWWRERADLRAVRRNRIYPMPSDLVLRQSPRILQGAEQVCATLDQARELLMHESR